MDAVRAADRAFARAPQFRLALVHPDSPCIFERDDEALAAANAAILSYTELAGATGPDLVIWPETTTSSYTALAPLSLPSSPG